MAVKDDKLNQYLEAVLKQFSGKKSSSLCVAAVSVLYLMLSDSGMQTGYKLEHYKK